MSDIPKHLTKGGPGDKFLGDGKVDTSEWFKDVPILEEQIKNGDIWFCTAPFQLINTATNGNWIPCSWAKEFIREREEDKFANIKDVSIERWFTHNEDLNKLRKEMTTPGSDLTLAKWTCQNCMEQEKKYGRSRRQTSLKIQSNDTGLWPGIRKAVEIFEVQVKAFGNTCNLDCYMCLPYDSSIRTDTVKREDMKTQKVFDENHIRNAKEFKPVTGSKIDSVIDQIVQIAPYIYNLKLIGGEPLVMKQFYSLLEKLVESGHAENMNIKYQTNMSVLHLDRLKIIDFIPKFKRFEFTVSLDGVGKYNDYIRRRGNFDEIENNIRTVKQFPNVIVNVNGTISFLSVLKFYQLIDWFHENQGELFDQLNWSNIRGPKRLQANVLPDEIKQSLIPLYENFPDIQNVLNDISYKHAIDYLLLQDARYKGTPFEANLFELYPELEKYYKEA